jgi:glycosyltransferase domain-containing protein
MLRLLRKQAMPYRIVIADSSDPTHARALRAACGDAVEIRSFPPDTDAYDKFIAVVEAIDTPYAVMVPDDDVTLPHAIEACVAHLANNPDTAVAQGYILDLDISDETFDLTHVRWFTPDIHQTDPVDRLYHLIRRYQPFFWGVFRKEVLLTALRRARAAGLVCFQEMTFMATAVILGKFARLPCIYSLRGTEESLTSRAQYHPFYAMLDDSDGLFNHYREYRDNLVSFIEANVETVSCGSNNLSHTLNLIHAIFFRPELQGGMMEYSVQYLLREAARPKFDEPPAKPAPRPVGSSDLSQNSVRPGRRYLWREEVFSAEPRDEITITPEERARVVAALEHYDIRTP